jgi:hypothetical protein
MENQQNELDIITQIRGEVRGNRVPTGENLFLAWGYPTAFFLIVEFAALIFWNEFWCEWIWLGIPLVGAPLMMYFLHKDYERTGRRTLDQNVILQMWIYIGFVSCVGGTTMGFAGVFEMLYCTFQGIIVGFGCFVTGVILRFRPKTVCGIIGTALSFVSLFFQGDLWPWQLLITAIVTVVTLIIPGHMFNKYVKSYGI